MVKEYFNNSVVIAVVTLILILYSGLFRIPSKYSVHSLIEYENCCYLKGILVSSPSKTSNGKNYLANLDLYSVSDSVYKSTAFGRVTLLIPSEIIEAYFPGKLYTPAKNKGTYIWETGGIYEVEGHFSNGFFIVKECNFADFKNDLNGKINKIRALGRLQFKRLMYSWGEGGGLLLALLCGAKEYTNPEIADAFRKAGLAHILALSGMHLSMFSGIAVFLGKKIKRKKLTFIIRIITLIIFLWFAGISPSLLRAFICCFLIILSNMVNAEKPELFIILCFSFIIQIIIMPDCWQNTGFILSYAALAGILLFNSYFRKILVKIMPGYLSASLSSSCSAQIFTAPVSLKLFGTFAPIGIIATAVISPLITIFIYSGLFLIVVSLLFPLFSYPSGIFMNFLYTIIKYSVGFFSKFLLIKV